MPKITSASTPAIRTIEPCLRTIFSRFSKKRTTGFAIAATIHPITNGRKNTTSLSPQTQTR